jgi:hypothetical protein
MNALIQIEVIRPADLPGAVGKPNTPPARSGMDLGVALDAFRG